MFLFVRFELLKPVAFKPGSSWHRPYPGRVGEEAEAPGTLRRSSPGLEITDPSDISIHAKGLLSPTRARILFNAYADLATIGKASSV